MRVRERLVYHEIHPLKITTDVPAGMAGLLALWLGHGRLGTFLIVVPPAAASVLVLATADLERERESRRGRYVLRSQSAPIRVARFICFGLAMIGARRRSHRLVVTGVAGVATCWLYGLPSFRT